MISIGAVCLSFSIIFSGSKWFDEKGKKLTPKAIAAIKNKMQNQKKRLDKKLE